MLHHSTHPAFTTPGEAALRPSSRQGMRKCRAYTLVEALLLVTILAVTGTGIGEALLSVAHVPANDEHELLIETQLLSQMETLRATWQSLPWGSSSAQITIGGNTYTMIIDKEKADPNGQGIQTSFYLLSVQIDDRSVCSYVSDL